MKQLQGRRLLIVDNHEDSRQLLEEVFVVEGARVLSAASTSEALQILSLVEPDLVLCEIALPELDGYALLHHIRVRQTRAGRHIPVIAVTGFDYGGMGDRALRTGFDGFFKKPVDIVELVVQVAHLTQRDVFQSLMILLYGCLT